MLENGVFQKVIDLLQNNKDKVFELCDWLEEDEGIDYSLAENEEVRII